MLHIVNIIANLASSVYYLLTSVHLKISGSKTKLHKDMDCDFTRVSVLRYRLLI